MTENRQDMSASIEAALAPQEEQKDHEAKRREQLSRGVEPASPEELEVARELVRSAWERGTAVTGPDDVTTRCLLLSPCRQGSASPN